MTSKVAKTLNKNKSNFEKPLSHMDPNYRIYVSNFRVFVSVQCEGQTKSLSFFINIDYSIINNNGDMEVLKI